MHGWCGGNKPMGPVLAGGASCQRGGSSPHFSHMSCLAQSVSSTYNYVLQHTWLQGGQKRDDNGFARAFGVAGGSDHLEKSGEQIQQVS